MFESTLDYHMYLKSESEQRRSLLWGKGKKVNKLSGGTIPVHFSDQHRPIGQSLPSAKSKAYRH